MTAMQKKAHDPTAHLSPEDIAQLGREIDAIREQVLASRGARDAEYIRTVIDNQRKLELASRAVLLFSLFPPAWAAGTAGLSVSKILENMEIGHNVMHGQWDWMNDPEIHSTTWEWDIVCPSSQWKHSHNYMHHQWTNVAGKDNDIGYGILRIDPNKPWQRWNLFQPLIFVTLASLFEYGVGFHDIEADVNDGEKVTWAKIGPKVREVARKIRRQVVKDYVAFPALALPLGAPSAVAAASGALTANVIRNLWSFTVIFCGHFPDGVEIFPKGSADNESRGGWYRRQILGSSNFEGGKVMNLMTGNLDFQIEHHLFPDMASTRYAEVAPRVREVCERHGLRYNTGSFARQFGTVIRKVLRYTLP